MKPKKQTRSAKPKRPSQLERDLRASIQIAKLTRRVSNLETAVLELQRYPEPNWERKAREMRENLQNREEGHKCESHLYPRS
jgi:hypothetical protein